MDIFNSIEPQCAFILLGMVAGAIELIKRIFDRDWKAVATILAAAVVGGLVALPLAVSPLLGVVVGLAASGYVTIAQNIGQK